MPDAYQHLRTLTLPAVAPLLGINLDRYKTRKGKHGPEIYGPCPVCQPKKNITAFSYSESGKWNCFSCSAKGNGAIDLTIQTLKIGFKEACDRLGGIKALPIEKAPVIVTSDATEALKPFDGSSYRKYAVDCPWLENRIPDKRIRDLYQVFCYSNPARKSAYSGRVMIPIKDVEGTLYGYLGRNIGDTSDTSPKYLFPRDFPKSRFAFGAAELKAGTLPLPLKLLYVVESPWTVMRFASMGLPCIALYGWSASPEQIEIMAGLSRAVCYLPDRNKSGQESAGVVQAIARRLYVHAPELPDGIDDPEHLNKLQVLAL